jgi:hypothetical protein
MRSMPDQTHDAKPMPHEHDGMTGPHGSMDDHGETHGHDDHAHGSDAMTLGPIDTAAWGAGAGGILLGLVVALALALSSGFIHF